MCVKGAYEGSYGLLPVEDSCAPAFDVDMLEAVPLAVWMSGFGFAMLEALMVANGCGGGVMLSIGKIS